MTWDELTPEEQCVLLGGAEGDLLPELLRRWNPRESREDHLAAVPGLAAAIVKLASMGLVEASISFDVGQNYALLPTEQLAAVVTDAENWWIGQRGPDALVEIDATDKAMAVLGGAGMD